MSAKVGDWVWHVHHEILVEPLTEPIENRIAYIKSYKPPEEVPTRLRLMKPVRGDISPPEYWLKAEAKCQEAYAKWEEAYAKWREADAKWQEAHAKCQETYAKWLASPSWKNVEALHAKECPNCPWNGRSIFP
jgi:hypothetical protein